jgi:hypothetical protein
VDATKNKLYVWYFKSKSYTVITEVEAAEIKKTLPKWKGLLPLW